MPQAKEAEEASWFFSLKLPLPTIAYNGYWSASKGSVASGLGTDENTAKVLMAKYSNVRRFPISMLGEDKAKGRFRICLLLKPGTLLDFTPEWLPEDLRNCG